MLGAKKGARARLILILVLFVLGQLVIGLLFSLPLRPIESPDSGSYLRAAANFPSSIHGPYWGYVGYIGFLRIGTWTGSATWFAVAINALAAVGASSALHALGRRFGGEIAGWVAVCAYLLNPMVAQWTRYVLTEPLFYAGIILTAYCLVRAIESSRVAWAPLWIVAVLTSSLRPNGILLLGAVATALALARQTRRPRRYLATSAIWACMLLLAVVSPTLEATFGDQNAFGPQAWAGTVVHGVPETAITMPKPTIDDPSNAAFIRYALEHPVDVGRLGATRIWWEAKQVRPWYSDQLNAFLTVAMTGFYVLAAIGMWSGRGTSLNLVVTSISIPFAAVIAATWAIWEGRFGWWFLVLWTVWAGVGATALFDRTTRYLPLDHRLRYKTDRPRIRLKRTEVQT